MTTVDCRIANLECGYYSLYAKFLMNCALKCYEAVSAAVIRQYRPTPTATTSLWMPA
jgi:hypothetical protein